MTTDRNTLLKLNSTGEYIAWNEIDGYHLTMDRSFARPFTEDEIPAQQTRLNQKLDHEDWLVQLWKIEKPEMDLDELLSLTQNSNNE